MELTGAIEAAADIRILFTGREREPGSALERVLAETAPAAPRRVAWARQIHSARSLRVEGAGLAGEGDALITTEPDLALAVFTADCLPILLAAPGMIGAVHAGWRGLAAGVIGRAVAAMDGPVRAWIGPAIGACCYEVGEDVAGAVVAASDESVLRPGPRGRPHLDLVAAARQQLLTAGLDAAAIEPLGPCTRCASDRWWSYRRDGAATGSNVSFIWRPPV